MEDIRQMLLSLIDGQKETNLMLRALKEGQEIAYAKIEALSGEVRDIRSTLQDNDKTLEYVIHKQSEHDAAIYKLKQNLLG